MDQLSSERIDEIRVRVAPLVPVMMAAPFCCTAHAFAAALEMGYQLAELDRQKQSGELEELKRLANLTDLRPAAPFEGQLVEERVKHTNGTWYTVCWPAAIPEEDRKQIRDVKFMWHLAMPSEPIELLWYRPFSHLDDGPLEVETPPAYHRISFVPD